jgi:hemoglobin
MQPRIRDGFRVLAAGLLTLGLSFSLIAADEPAEAPDSKKELNKSLRDVINRGADLYNAGDPGGCYQLFRGALMTARPSLAADAQKSVDTALADAERNQDPRRKAWLLRRSLDEVRAQLGGKAPEKVGEPAAKSLWDRLGGEAGVAKVVDDWAGLLASNEKVNFSRGGKIDLNDEKVAALKKSAVAWVSSQTGGPIKYTGKSMKQVHKGMEITDAEFDAAVADLVEALKSNKVGKEEMDAVLGAVEKTRKDIVEAKSKPKEKDKEEDKKKDKDEEKKKDKDEEKKKDKE